MRKVAIIIALQRYADAAISQIKYAPADAQSFASALEALGFDASDRQMLISDEATKTTIESRIRKTLTALAEDDVLYLYYAGHSFTIDNRNFITGYDSDLDDLEHTSIALEWLFDTLRRSACGEAAVFLDASNANMATEAPTASSQDEFKNFFAESKHRVCLTSCKPGESSHTSDDLQHGIWAHHLLEAFTGNTDTALKNGTLLTATALQEHLSAEMPRTLRSTLTGIHAQNPCLYGSPDRDFTLADISSLQSGEKSNDPAGANQLKRVCLYAETFGDIRKLSGFIKAHHQPPKHTGAYAEEFVRKIGQVDVDEDSEATYQRLRDIFGFKRKDVQTDSYDGGGTIITPYFDYNVTVAMQLDDASGYVLRREISNIREPQQLFSEEFVQTFPNDFDTLEFETKSEISIDDLIDKIEDLEDDSIEVTHDKDATYCEIGLDSSNLTIHVTPRNFRLSLPHASSPKLLVESFFEVQRELLQDHGIMQLSFYQE
ncbi:MAG: caspase family protein [Phycisphaerales bacterium]|jgi:hypothetical protein|nr:caspase family protein [Phycisphaerales bacterium]